MYLSINHNADTVLISSLQETDVRRLADERERRLAVECDRLGLKKKGWPRLPTNLLVNDKWKAIYCMVGKVASSTWKKVFLMATGHLDPRYWDTCDTPVIPVIHL